jgi:hypothetical protein
VSQRQRLLNLGIAVVIAVVAVVVILAASGGSDDDGEQQAAAPPAASTQPEASGGAEATTSPPEQPKEPPPPEIVVKDGKPVGGVTEIRVNQGDRIRFRVVSDVEDEVHVHAYDIEKDVGPGEPASFDFKASITGITEAELEDRGEQIASIRVDP